MMREHGTRTPGTTITRRVKEHERERERERHTIAPLPQAVQYGAVRCSAAAGDNILTTKQQSAAATC